MKPKAYGLRLSRKTTWGWVLPFALVPGWALVCLAYCTQSLARTCGYPAAFGASFRGWYWPWECLLWLHNYPRLNEAENVTNAQMLFVFPLIFVLLLGLAFARKPKGRDDVHGSARWADKTDIQQAGLLAGGGVYVGGWMDGKIHRYLKHDGPEHVLVFAPTRSGKGVGLVIPTLLEWPHSTLTLDIKGENHDKTAGYRAKALKHRVLRFEPTDCSGKAARFNPLAEVRMGSLHAIADVQNICTMIMDPDGKGLKDYFEKAGYSFLVGICLHMLVLGESSTSLTDVIGFITRDRDDVKEMFVEILDADHAQLLRERGIPSEVAQYMKVAIHSSAAECMAKAERELSGVISSAMANLSLYRDPIVASNTSVSDFAISDLMHADAAMDLYFVVPPSDLDRMKPLMRLFFNIALRRLTESMDSSAPKYKHRLLLMLDEFTSLGKLEIMQKSLAFMAGYGLKAYIIVQDTTQLQEAYSKEEAITSNCHIRIAYAPNKVETANLLSSMTGKTTVVHKKTSLSGKRSGQLSNASVSVSEVARPLLTPDECMRLPGMVKDSHGKAIRGGDMLIFPAGSNPVYGRQILYFLDPELSRRSSIPAPGKENLKSQLKTFVQETMRQKRHEKANIA